MASTDEHTLGIGDEETVAAQLAAGRAAMETIAGYEQDEVDDLARAVAWGVLREDRRTDLIAAQARETGVGTQHGTEAKLDQLLRNGLGEILGEPSVGRINTDRDGVVEVAKPVGVIGALVPSTNPAATTAFLAMLAVKGRNAIVVSPSPAAVETCELTISYIQDELGRIGAPQELVQMLNHPITRDRAHTLLETADFAHVTGSMRNVRAGETAGTPNYCVGTGNATALVDETADLDAAAATIAAGTSFDHGAVCTSESNVIVDNRVADTLLDRFASEGGYVCSPAESTALANAVDRSLVGRPAAEIAEAAGIGTPLGHEPSFLVARGGRGVDRRLADEKLAPVVTVFRADGFDAALEHISEILTVSGAGHSCVLHTNREDRIERLAREVDVCRAVVNQSGALGLAGYGNDLDTTLCLGAGVWGGNQLDENLTYRHFITTTRVARPDEHDVPSDAALFGDYLDRIREDDTGKRRR